MAYIGKEPIVGNFQKCDAITVVNGQAAYTLQVSSTNVVPESSSHMLVSLNGILQAPVTSFTVSGSTLTFASNLATGDVIDFVILLGNVLDLGTPSDGTVTNAKLASDLISGETDIGGAIADADLFLMDDGAGGTLRKTAASRIKTYVGGGLSEVDTWRLTSDLNSNADPITSNLERPDDAAAGRIGTGMSVSSGIWTFPSTGIWQVTWIAACELNSDSLNANMYATINNSNYDIVAWAPIGMQDNRPTGSSISAILDVTDTSNVKVKFVVSSMAGGSDTILKGSTDENLTTFTFIRLGDT